ncbi:uncharacterized protein LOC129586785 isoform X2 [Paramacrobiotus metropolitanus]|uniref:uncharacterized protein LOC129586785 isoform X2 n=1 Tax=Paramacrobiotus metropolitanus TaxID=2943436 RepID=UPI0024458441|nr:uncharacterized protein LOC129586785 isoform X2 [Paramacrobiotus metropolitanus]
MPDIFAMDLDRESSYERYPTRMNPHSENPIGDFKGHSAHPFVLFPYDYRIPSRNLGSAGEDLDMHDRQLHEKSFSLSKYPDVIHGAEELNGTYTSFNVSDLHEAPLRTLTSFTLLKERPKPLDMFKQYKENLDPSKSSHSQKHERISSAATNSNDADSVASLHGRESGFTLTPSNSHGSFEIIEDAVSDVEHEKELPDLPPVCSSGLVLNDPHAEEEKQAKTSKSLTIMPPSTVWSNEQPKSYNSVKDNTDIHQSLEPKAATSQEDHISRLKKLHSDETFPAEDEPRIAPSGSFFLENASSVHPPRNRLQSESELDFSWLNSSEPNNDISSIISALDELRSSVHSLTANDLVHKEDYSHWQADYLRDFPVKTEQSSTELERSSESEGSFRSNYEQENNQRPIGQLDQMYGRMCSTETDFSNRDALYREWTDENQNDTRLSNNISDKLNVNPIYQTFSQVNGDGSQTGVRPHAIQSDETIPEVYSGIVSDINELQTALQQFADLQERKLSEAELLLETRSDFTGSDNQSPFDPAADSPMIHLAEENAADLSAYDESHTEDLRKQLIEDRDSAWEHRSQNSAEIAEDLTLESKPISFYIASQQTSRASTPSLSYADDEADDDHVYECLDADIEDHDGGSHCLTDLLVHEAEELYSAEYESSLASADYEEQALQPLSPEYQSTQLHHSNQEDIEVDSDKPQSSTSRIQQNLNDFGTGCYETEEEGPNDYQNSTVYVVQRDKPLEIPSILPDIVKGCLLGIAEVTVVSDGDHLLYATERSVSPGTNVEGVEGINTDVLKIPPRSGLDVIVSEGIDIGPVTINTEVVADMLPEFEEKPLVTDDLCTQVLPPHELNKTWRTELNDQAECLARQYYVHTDELPESANEAYNPSSEALIYNTADPEYRSAMSAGAGVIQVPNDHSIRNLTLEECGDTDSARSTLFRGTLELVSAEVSDCKDDLPNVEFKVEAESAANFQKDLPVITLEIRTVSEPKQQNLPEIVSERLECASALNALPVSPGTGTKKGSSLFELASDSSDEDSETDSTADNGDYFTSREPYYIVEETLTYIEDETTSATLSSPEVAKTEECADNGQSHDQWRLADHVSPNELADAATNMTLSCPDILQHALEKIFAQEREVEADSGDTCLQSRTSSRKDCRNAPDAEGITIEKALDNQPLKTSVFDLVPGQSEPVVHDPHTPSLAVNRVLRPSGHRSWYKLADLPSTVTHLSELRVSYVQKPDSAVLPSTTGSKSPVRSLSTHSSGFGLAEKTDPDKPVADLPLADVTSHGDTKMPEHKVSEDGEPTPEYLRRFDELMGLKKEWTYDKGAVEPYTHLVNVIPHEGVHEPTAVFLYPCLLPDHADPDYDKIMENLLLYVLSHVQKIDKEPYRIVFFNSGIPHGCEPSAFWLQRVYKSMDETMKENLIELLIVHPHFKIRAQLQTAGRAILRRLYDYDASLTAYSKEFFRKIKFVNGLKELGRVVSIQYAAIPKPVRDYDRRREWKLSKACC